MGEWEDGNVCVSGPVSERSGNEENGSMEISVFLVMRVREVGMGEWEYGNLCFWSCD